MNECKVHGKSPSRTCNACTTYRLLMLYDTCNEQRERIAELEANACTCGGWRDKGELEQQLAELREAFDRLISVAEQCDGWEFFPSEELDAARSALQERNNVL